MKTRAEKVKAGKIWQVYFDAKPDEILFEGSRTACQKFCRDHDYEQWRKKGIIRIGQLISDDYTKP